LGNLDEGSSIREIGNWMKGLWGWSISLHWLCGGGLGGGAPSLWTLEEMLRKSPDTGISLNGVPFSSKGILVCGGGLIFWRL